MSIRFGLMALLEQEPMYGYQLRQQFERATGATWPLNIGQVYTTLARLERDGLVVQFGPPDAEGRQLYKLTDEGHADLATWFDTPIENNDRPRDELAIKIAMAVTSPGQDVAAVLQKQRTATMRTLQELTRLRAQANVDRDMAWLLVLDSMIFRAEAELRWLNHSETRLARMATTGRSGADRTTAATGHAAPTATGPDQPASPNKPGSPDQPGAATLDVPNAATRASAGIPTPTASRHEAEPPEHSAQTT